MTNKSNRVHSLGFLWAVQTNLPRRPRADVVAQLSTLGLPYIGVDVIPFSEELTFLSETPAHNRIIPYGSTSLLKRAMQRNWRGLFFDPALFRVDAWLAHRDDMLNQAEMLAVEEVLERYRHREGFWHVRPLEDLKRFTGIVMSSSELIAWVEGAAGVPLSDGVLPQETLLAISPARELLAEWRWIIVGGDLMDGSLYRREGRSCYQHEEDSKIIAKAKDLTRGWLPHETCVMDVALTAEGFRVIEFNCFNGSGFYDHDLSRILPAVTAYTQHLN